MSTHDRSQTPQHDVALELGRLSIALAFFDRYLAGAFGRVAGKGLVAASDEFVRVRYTSEKVKLLRAAIAQAPQASRADELLPLLDLRMLVNDRRNRLMHDVWAVADGQYVIWQELVSGSYPPDFRPTPVNANELAGLTAAVQGAARSLLDWIWNTHPEDDTPA